MSIPRPNDFIADTIGLSPTETDLTTIRTAYSTHRQTRHQAQIAKILTPSTLLTPDAILRSIVTDHAPDTRNCLVLWTRPPQHILALAEEVQKKLLEGTPGSWGAWLMPTHNMHMTVVEVAFSRTPEEINDMIKVLRPAAIEIASFTVRRRARLVKPFLSFDTSAFALSFLPATDEPVLDTSGQFMTACDVSVDSIKPDDSYTYHHLRRDILAEVKKAGLNPVPRYQVPSAHITLGRFTGTDTEIKKGEAEKWVAVVAEINDWLRRTYWDNNDPINSAEWIIGQELGLDVRYGPVWYGGGKSLVVGEGF